MTAASSKRIGGVERVICFARLGLARAKRSEAGAQGREPTERHIVPGQPARRLSPTWVVDSLARGLDDEAGLLEKPPKFMGCAEPSLLP